MEAKIHMKKEIKIGLTILLGVLLLYLALTWIKSTQLFAVSRSGYDIRFQDVSGLKEGDPVTVFGYPSGNVESIRIDGDGAMVHITLSEEIAVQTDASAFLKVKEIMGGKVIELLPGRSGRKIGAGQAITGATSLDFSSAFAKTGEFLDKFDVNDIDSLMGDISKLVRTFSKMSDELDTLDTHGMVKDLRESASSLNHILADVERRKLVASIDESLDKVDRLAAKAETSLTSITALTDHINDKTMPQADSMMTKVNDMLGDSEGMIADVKKILKQFQDRSTLAGQLLYDPAFAQQVDGTLKNLDKTLDHIRTKKIYVTMTLSKGQKVFTEDPIEVNGEKVK
jgi:phospholipid/cholesterol/gamma-HCH transport system substrate-binding protein